MNPPPSPAAGSPCPPLVLTFGHADPTGAGGIQADVLTLASVGAYALCVTTAVTVQDTSGASSLLPLDAEWVDDQARALLEDCRVAAFKVGLLGSIDAVYAVAAVISDYDDVPVVLHAPLLHLLDDEGADDILAAMRDLLVPQAKVLVLTPQDARILLGDSDSDSDSESEIESETETGAETDEGSDGDAAPLPRFESPEEQAGRIIAGGCAAVLMVGASDDSGAGADLLLEPAGLRRSWRREDVHGAFPGAAEMLAAAIAGGLATGDSLTEAVDKAQNYTVESLRAGFRPGMGRLLPDRLFWARRNDEELDDAR